MQQLIDLVNQNANLDLDSLRSIVPSDAVNILCLLITASAVFIALYMGRDKVAKTIAIIGIIALGSLIGLHLFEDHARQAKIKANNIKIEQIEKSVINSQSSQYPFCVAMEENDSVDSNQTLVFFHNKQDAINFIQKNKDDKNIFVTNYLKSHDSTFLERGSNQTIENDFDCMQAEHTKKALTQMANSIKQNDN